MILIAVNNHLEKGIEAIGWRMLRILWTEITDEADLFVVHSTW